MSSSASAKPASSERLLDLLGELKIERVFGNAARAHRAGHFEGVADIDDDAEIRTLASVRLRRSGARSSPRAGCRPAASSSAARTRERKSGVAQSGHHARIPSMTGRYIGLPADAWNLAFRASSHLCAARVLSYQNGRVSVGWVKYFMGKFVVGCVVLFVLALGFMVVTQAQDIAALFEAFRAEPLTQKLAWFVIVLIPLALIPAALWLATRSCGSVTPPARSSCGSAACGRA